MTGPTETADDVMGGLCSLAKLCGGSHAGPRRRARSTTLAGAAPEPQPQLGGAAKGLFIPNAPPTFFISPPRILQAPRFRVASTAVLRDHTDTPFAT